MNIFKKNKWIKVDLFYIGNLGLTQNINILELKKYETHVKKIYPNTFNNHVCELQIHLFKHTAWAQNDRVGRRKKKGPWC